MKILFLTLAYPFEENESNLYTDLMQEFVYNGHEVHVVCQIERRSGKNTEWTEHRNIPVLRVKTGNVTKTNIIEKGLSTLSIENTFLKAIYHFNRFDNIDLILYSTPPITFSKVINKLKKDFNAKTYLLLKDIFPQNAIDLEMFKSNGIVSRFFRAKEKQLYKISDYIGCMSEGNKQYIIKHNSNLNVEKIEVNPNSIIPTQEFPLLNKDEIKREYGISTNQLLFIYGGNLGKPQGIDYLIETLKVYHKYSEIFFLIIGSGTEYEKLKSHIEKKQYKNIKLLKAMPKEEYEKLVQIADLGLIYLDKRFTIPNIPSRILSYMDKSIPILAVTDCKTDLKEIIASANNGYFSEAGDLQDFSRVVEQIIKESNLLTIKGSNGRKYLESYFSVQNSYDIIMQHFK